MGWRLNLVRFHWTQGQDDNRAEVKLQICHPWGSKEHLLLELRLLLDRKAPAALAKLSNGRIAGTHQTVIDHQVQITVHNLSRKKNCSWMWTSSTTIWLFKWYSQIDPTLTLRGVRNTWWMLLSFQIRPWLSFCSSVKTFHCQKYQIHCKLNLPSPKEEVEI